MRMSLRDMDALQGVPTQNKQHAKNNLRGPGFSPDKYPLNMENLESHLPEERGIKFMPIAESVEKR
jgi:hypothetical protein